LPAAITGNGKLERFGAVLGDQPSASVEDFALIIHGAPRRTGAA
jgi:hypothetical protein